MQWRAALAALVVASSVAQALPPAAGQADDGLPHAGGPQVRLSIPRAVCLLGPAGRLHALLGLPGAYLLGEPVIEGVLSAACGEGFILVKTAQALEWLDAGGRLTRRWPAPEGPALLGAAADGPRALVYLPESGQWFLAVEDRLFSLRVALGSEGEEVLSIALTGQDLIAVALRRSGRLWWVQAGLDGSITAEHELAEASAPVLVLSDGAVAWGAGEGLVFQAPTGAQRRIPLPAPPAELASAGEQGILVQPAGGRRRLFVRLSADRQELHRLPEVPQ